MPTRQYAWACPQSHAHAKTAGVGMAPGIPGTPGPQAELDQSS